jgi:glucarate dehydratase
MSSISVSRRSWLAQTAGVGLIAGSAKTIAAPPTSIASDGNSLTITGLQITPIALPDPPLLAASGCHGPYFLRNIIELETDSGVVGIAETHGGERTTTALANCRPFIVRQSALAYRKFASELMKLGHSVHAGIELACLDALGRASGRRLCDLLGGPVRDQVEFASYLFFRYPSDHQAVLNDPRLVDHRSKGSAALDPWGEVRSAESMAELAWKFHQKFGFRVHKLKAGVFDPQLEVEALAAINDRFSGKHRLRIDPNGRWTVPTAVTVGRKLKDLPLEYYEDPVNGQVAMAEVRRATGLPTSTNSCVTRFEHIPDAIRTEPIDVVLGDHHGWGGITAFQTLGTIAETLGWGLSQHSNSHAGITMAAMIHVGAVTPQLTFASDTHYVWLPEQADIIEGPNLCITDGHVPVPKGTGLGVTLDRDKLAKAHEVYRKCGMRQRDDRGTMQRFQPGWSQKKF